MNELLYIKLSLRTTGPSFERVYKEFKRVFPKWDDVYTASQTKVAQALLNAGLANQKAKDLKNIIEKLMEDFGKVSLAPVKGYSENKMEEYLCALPGIGKKAARCIMLYSFGKQVFPVDAHCFRIIKRLGWIDNELNYTDKLADRIQTMIPPQIRYSLHVNMVAHGRVYCLERFPKCGNCPLMGICSYGKERTKVFD